MITHRLLPMLDEVTGMDRIHVIRSRSDHVQYHLILSRPMVTELIEGQGS